MNQILEQIQKEKKLVSLYGHMGGEQTVLTGYILYMTEEELADGEDFIEGRVRRFCAAAAQVFFQGRDGRQQRTEDGHPLSS